MNKVLKTVWESAKKKKKKKKKNHAQASLFSSPDSLLPLKRGLGCFSRTAFDSLIFFKHPSSQLKHPWFHQFLAPHFALLPSPPCHLQLLIRHIHERHPHARETRCCLITQQRFVTKVHSIWACRPPCVVCAVYLGGDWVSGLTEHSPHRLGLCPTVKQNLRVS